MKVKENFMADYLSKFITVCFTVESGGEKTKIGSGEPLFNVKINNDRIASFNHSAILSWTKSTFKA